ncbi:MAG: glycosyltransferase [Caldilineaceae bacterium]
MNVYIRDMSREMARRGIQVDIFTRRQSSDDPQIQLDQVEGVRVIHVDAGPSHPIPVNDVPLYLNEFADNVINFGEAHALHYDLIHAHYWLSGIVAEQLRIVWNVPFAQMFHTLGQLKNQIARNERERSPQQRLDGELQVVQSANVLVAATPAEKDQLIELYHADSTKIVVIPPGVDLSRFQPINHNLARDFLSLPRQLRQILFTGRIEALKGIDVLLHAVALIRRQQPELLNDVQVTIIGGDPTATRRDPEMARLQDLRCELGLCEIVRFIGAKEQSSLPFYYASADIVVMPSHYESFGLVALEAMAMGTPVIASDVGGLTHLVRSGQTGYLVPRNEPEALADRIAELLSHEELRQQLGRQAAVHARNYEWSRIGERIIDEVYVAMLSDKLVCDSFLRLICQFDDELAVCREAGCKWAMR